MGLLTDGNKEMKLSWYDMFGIKFGIMDAVGLDSDARLYKHMVQDMKTTRSEFWRGQEGVIRTILRCMGDDATEYVSNYVNSIKESGIIDGKNVFLREPGSIREIYAKCAEQKILTFDNWVIVPSEIYMGITHESSPYFENVVLSFNVVLVENLCFRAMEDSILLYLYSFAPTRLTSYISLIYV